MDKSKIVKDNFFRSTKDKCPGTAKLSEDSVQILTPHKEHDSPVPIVMAKKVEHDVFLSLPPNSSLRFYIAAICEKFEEAGIDKGLMSSENALKWRLAAAKRKQHIPRPSIKTFFDLGMNLNDL